MARVRQSRTGSGLGFQIEDLQPFKLLHLGSEAQDAVNKMRWRVDAATLSKVDATTYGPCSAVRGVARTGKMCVRS